MRRTQLLLLIGLLTVPSFVSADVAGAERTGSICIAPLPENARELDRGYPGGKAPREYSYEFAIQIDDRQPVRVAEATSRLVTGLSLGKRHRARIYDGKRIIESFHFTFEKRGSEHLCLFYTPWYQTWSLEKPDNRPWCKCSEPAA